jgi:multisubunit Na+/H+ antiporter MnhB subunit
MHYATEGMVFYLFGLFCAYWAQASKRNAWLWFFMGLLFAPLTGLVLLYKNSQERAAQARPAAPTA